MSRIFNILASFAVVFVLATMALGYGLRTRDIRDPADSVAQKKALGMILSRIEMWKNEIGRWEVQLAVREEFAELFGDMQTLVVYECPQGNSNPCRSLERAVS